MYTGGIYVFKLVLLLCICLLLWRGGGSLSQESRRAEGTFFVLSTVCIEIEPL